MAPTSTRAYRRIGREPVKLTKNCNLQARLNLIELNLAVELSVVLAFPERFIHALLVPNVSMAGNVEQERSSALSSGQTACLQLCKAKSRNCIHNRS
jgi:hypothetical protein